MMGILVWGGVVVLNLAVLLTFQHFRKSQIVPIRDILFTVLISDVVIHLVVAATAGFGEMVMWLIISFPIVAAPSLVVCFAGKAVYDHRRKRRAAEEEIEQGDTHEDV